MKKDEIIYERDITHSYMKVLAEEEDSLDVKIILHQNIKGMIAMERCYVNGKGEYWYDISGKQALDGFLKLHVFTYALFEKLILRICEQFERLEWNLLNQNGLILEPEYIFVNNKGEQFSFLFYPHEKQDVMQEFQKLLEYLLTKLDHSKHEDVQGAYEIYELTVSESYHIQDIKNMILKRRMQENVFEEVKEKEEVEEETETEEYQSKEQGIFLQEEDYLQKKIIEPCKEFYKKIKTLFIRKQKEEMPTVIYPEEETEDRITQTHPTICIGGVSEKPKGMLLYEGMGDYPDFELGKEERTVGKSREVSLQISKETISHFHAKIAYKDGWYYIEDINSTNGTFVNEELLNYREQRKLNGGDLIRFADVKYRFL